MKDFIYELAVAVQGFYYVEVPGKDAVRVDLSGSLWSRVRDAWVLHRQTNLVHPEGSNVTSRGVVRHPSRVEWDMKLFYHNFLAAVRGYRDVTVKGKKFRVRFPGTLYERLHRLVFEKTLIPTEWN